MSENTSSTIQLPEGWKKVLEDQFSLPYMQHLKCFLLQRKQQGAAIFPPSSQWFNALNLTDFAEVRVVILGQDPYHGLGQAHGLSFSVLPPTPAPPSLINIMKELKEDLMSSHTREDKTDLTDWAKQGVLLLNSVLTVEENQPASHTNQGWEIFTDAIIDVLSRKRENLVFLLWGNYAKNKGKIISGDRHCIIHSAHPSPLSAHRGFLVVNPSQRQMPILERMAIKKLIGKLFFRLFACGINPIT